MKPRFQIITVVKDDPKGLYRTLNSIQSQLVEDVHLEILVVIGDSSPSSLHVTTEFQNLMIDTISRPPRGVYNAMNEGLRSLTNKLDSSTPVLFLNAGDFLIDRSAISKLSAASSIKPLTSSLAAMIDTCKFPMFNIPDIIVGQGKFEMHPLKFWFPHQGFVARWQVFETIGFFDENFRVAGDYDWIYRAINEFGLPTQIDSPLVAQIIGGLSNIRSYSGYRERQRIAKRENLLKLSLPLPLVCKMYLKEWLFDHARKLFELLGSEVSTEIPMTKHFHENPSTPCPWCQYFNFN